MSLTPLRKIEEDREDGEFAMQAEKIILTSAFIAFSMRIIRE